MVVSNDKNIRAALKLDSYLEIAQKILRIAKRPMGPRGILDAAYKNGVVPSHLYGKTQHKTLQARISEDILNFRDKSLFFRTEPGKFFLREFIADKSLPPEFRDPIATKRRSRELKADLALAINLERLSEEFKPRSKIAPSRMLEFLKEEKNIYESPKAISNERVFIWAFVAVRKNCEILSYRAGKYREHRESFMSKRSIGFSSMVDQENLTLFNMEDFGILDTGVSSAIIDLDIPLIENHDEHKEVNAEISYFTWIPNGIGTSEIIAVIDYICPDWFEPVKKRLAINNLQWLKVDTRVNDIEDFDPWSQTVLALNNWAGQTQADCKTG